MIFDTHTHYYDEAFDADRDVLLASLPGRGAILVVCPVCDLESSRQSIILAERYGFLCVTVGYHPENLEGAALSDLDTIKTLYAHPKMVAAGEIGLDYYWLKTPEGRANSRDFSDTQLSLAEGLNLPAIVYDQDTHRDYLGIARTHPGVRGVFHRCSGSLKNVKVLVGKGWMLPFTGSITSKDARRAPDILRRLPLDRPVLETDAPYMALEPCRGQRCDSTTVARSTETMAQLRGLTRNKVEAVALENGKKFFGIA